LGVLRCQCESLRDAQARAVQQQQHGGVARGDPVELGLRPRIDHLGGLADGERLGDAMCNLGKGDLHHAAIAGDLLCLQPAEEGAQGRHAAGQRSAGQAIAAAGGHEAAEQLGIQPGEIGQAGSVAEIVLSARPGTGADRGP
jgi:hypothetical protein